MPFIYNKKNSFKLVNLGQFLMSLINAYTLVWVLMFAIHGLYLTFCDNLFYQDFYIRFHYLAVSNTRDGNFQTYINYRP